MGLMMSFTRELVMALKAPADDDAYRQIQHVAPGDELFELGNEAFRL